MRDLTDEEVYKITRGNAIRMLRLDLDHDLDAGGRRAAG